MWKACILLTAMFTMLWERCELCIIISRETNVNCQPLIDRVVSLLDTDWSSSVTAELWLVEQCPYWILIGWAVSLLNPDWSSSVLTESWLVEQCHCWTLIGRAVSHTAEPQLVEQCHSWTLIGRAVFLLNPDWSNSVTAGTASGWGCWGIAS